MLPCNGTYSSQQTTVYYLIVTSGRTYSRFKPPRCLLYQVHAIPARQAGHFVHSSVSYPKLIERISIKFGLGQSLYKAFVTYNFSSYRCNKSCKLHDAEINFVNLKEPNVFQSNLALGWVCVKSNLKVTFSVRLCAIKLTYTTSSSNQAFDNILSRTKQLVQWLGHRLHSPIIVVI
jgi:hypothetical protein